MPFNHTLEAAFAPEFLIARASYQAVNTFILSRMSPEEKQKLLIKQLARQYGLDFVKENLGEIKQIKTEDE